jgi:ribosomal protein L16 Arg81 hydroxylase
MLTGYWRRVPHYAILKEVMQTRFRIVRQPCWSPRKLIKTILKMVRQPQKSCIDVVFKLPATTTRTRASNLLPELVRLLESQLQDERYQSAVLQQEADGLRKSLQNSDAYFLVQQQALEDLVPNKRKLISMLSFLPAWWVLRISFLELF